jgi:hypothetical protein
MSKQTVASRCTTTHMCGTAHRVDKRVFKETSVGLVIMYVGMCVRAQTSRRLRARDIAVIHLRSSVFRSKASMHTRRLQDVFFE